jgi:WD40 repeat protein
LVHADGSISYCNPSRSIIARDKILGVSENKIIAIEELVDSEKRVLVEFDLSSCQVSQVVYSPQGNEMLMDFSYTRNGILALELGTIMYWQNDPQNTDFVGIRIFDPEMNIVNEIENVFTPSLSPDGRKIAFTAASGEVCVSDLDTIVPSCSGETSGTITWSPDGEWLSYSDLQDHIVLQNVETGATTTIARGIYPSWRP